MSLIRGDARYIPLKDKSVHAVITSPPYWGLRDYLHASWSGGDPDCEHKGPLTRQDYLLSEKQASNCGANSVAVGNCRKCGAVRDEPSIWDGASSCEHDFESRRYHTEQ